MLCPYVPSLGGEDGKWVEPPGVQHTRSCARPCRHPSYGRQSAEWLPPIWGCKGFPKCSALSKYRGAMAIHTSHRPRGSPKGQEMSLPLSCFPQRSWSEDGCVPTLFLKCYVVWCLLWNYPGSQYLRGSDPAILPAPQSTTLVHLTQDTLAKVERDFIAQAVGVRDRVIAQAQMAPFCSLLGVGARGEDKRC